jgi:DDE superfamily endonuclease
MGKIRYDASGCVNDAAFALIHEWTTNEHVSWGLIGVGVRKLIFFPDETVDSKMYVAKCLEPSKRLLTRRGAVFVQDGARCHMSSNTSAWLNKNRVTTVAWPPCSPDLNPIENMWAIGAGKG